MSTVPHDTPTTPAPVESLARELNVTLAALRASLETCRDEASEPRAHTLEGALDQLGRLSHDIHALIDAARPLTLAPLRCSVRELVGEAVRSLEPSLCARIRTGDVVDASLCVDGPVVTRALAYLLECAAGETSGPIDLVTRWDQHEVHLEVSAPIERRRARASDELHLAALALGLARRDVQRSGGRLIVSERPDDALQATVVFPANQTEVPA